LNVICFDMELEGSRFGERNRERENLSNWNWRRYEHLPP